MFRSQSEQKSGDSVRLNVLFCRVLAEGKREEKTCRAYRDFWWLRARFQRAPNSRSVKLSFETLKSSLGRSAIIPRIRDCIINDARFHDEEMISHSRYAIRQASLFLARRNGLEWMKDKCGPIQMFAFVSCFQMRVMPRRRNHESDDRLCKLITLEDPSCEPRSTQDSLHVPNH